MEKSSMLEYQAFVDNLRGPFSRYAEVLYDKVTTQEVKEGDALQLGESDFVLSYAGDGTNNEKTVRAHLFNIFSKGKPIGSLQVDQKYTIKADDDPVEHVGLYDNQQAAIWLSGDDWNKQYSYKIIAPEMKLFVQETVQELARIASERDQSHVQTDS